MVHRSAATQRDEARREESELVLRIASGDEQALALLYDRFGGLLLSLAQRILGDLAEAEEILQETLLQVWRQADRYDPRRSSVSTWLVLILRSRGIDRLRSRQVSERTARSSFEQNPVQDTSPEGTANVLHAERRSRLKAELERLPPEQKEVLDLAFYGGLTQSQIATRTGIPLGTVKTRTLLAMKKLRHSLASEIGDLL